MSANWFSIAKKAQVKETRKFSAMLSSKIHHSQASTFLKINKIGFSFVLHEQLSGGLHLPLILLKTSKNMEMRDGM